LCRRSQLGQDQPIAEEIETHRGEIVERTSGPQSVGHNISRAETLPTWVGMEPAWPQGVEMREVVKCTRGELTATTQEVL
jgi:hypothetical protein